MESDRPHSSCKRYRSIFEKYGIRYVRSILGKGIRFRQIVPERKILLDYALGEVKTLSRNSTHMLFKIRDIKAKVLRNKRAFQYYVNRDKQVVENIMKNIKSF